MRNSLGIIAIGFCLSLCHLATAATWHVDASVPSSGDGTTWETAFSKIQQGIDAAADGDTVIVAQGAYVENIHFDGKNIILRSTDPLNPDVVANTIIDGNQAGSVVTFSGDEDETCVLSGFTIQNGRTDDWDGAGIRGGTWEDRTHATIRNNRINDNRAVWRYKGGSGGGLAHCDGTVNDNLFTRNIAERGGGGLYDCNGEIRGNTISHNSGLGGGGLGRCDGLIQNNVIVGNAVRGRGGGLHYCNGTIQNNSIVGNSARLGGAMGYCGGAIQNNTIVGNSAEEDGGGLHYCRGSIRNCVIWGNKASGSPNQISGSSAPSFCSIQSWNAGGNGNMSVDPLFVDGAGSDYRLDADSPCIGAGANYYWFAWPQRDLDRNCRLAGDRVDMGCYEYGASPDSDGDLLSDPDEASQGTDRDRDDSDGDGLRDGLEVLRRSDPLARTDPRTVWVPGQAVTIQECLCLAVEGDEVVVSPGTYRENLHFCGVDVVLHSSDPEDPDIVSSTIIDGGGAGPVVSFLGTESEACLLAGFVVRNGRGYEGGGICGGMPDNHTNSTIRNNVITANYAYHGAGLAYSDGRVQDNTITANSSIAEGGGVFRCDGIVENNLIAGNHAKLDGGGLYGCQGTTRNNTIVRNSAGSGGGGLFFCRGAILNCIIWGNEAMYGAQLYESSVPTYSCIGEHPRFVDAENGDFRLLPSSPCIDAGYNDPELPGTDIAGMHRIMFGGKSLTVDMGAYEYYVNDVNLEPTVGQATLRWSSLADKTYSILYSEDLLNWNLADDSVLTAGNETTFWVDDGSKTGVAPTLVPCRFYRILENP